MVLNAHPFTTLTCIETNERAIRRINVLLGLGGRGEGGGKEGGKKGKGKKGKGKEKKKKFKKRGGGAGAGAGAGEEGWSKRVHLLHGLSIDTKTTEAAKQKGPYQAILHE